MGRNNVFKFWQTAHGNVTGTNQFVLINRRQNSFTDYPFDAEALREELLQLDEEHRDVEEDSEENNEEDVDDEDLKVPNDEYFTEDEILPKKQKSPQMDVIEKRTLILTNGRKQTNGSGMHVF